MFAIAGYLLVLIYVLAALAVITFILTIVAAVILSIHGCIEDKRYYERRK